MDCAKVFVFVARCPRGRAGDVVGCIEGKEVRDFGIVCRDNARRAANGTVLAAIVDLNRRLLCASDVRQYFRMLQVKKEARRQGYQKNVKLVLTSSSTKAN